MNHFETRWLFYHKNILQTLDKNTQDGNFVKKFWWEKSKMVTDSTNFRLFEMSFDTPSFKVLDFASDLEILIEVNEY